MMGNGCWAVCEDIAVTFQKYSMLTRHGVHEAVNSHSIGLSVDSAYGGQGGSVALDCFV